MRGVKLWQSLPKHVVLAALAVFIIVMQVYSAPVRHPPGNRRGAQRMVVADRTRQALVSRSSGSRSTLAAAAFTAAPSPAPRHHPGHPLKAAIATCATLSLRERGPAMLVARLIGGVNP